MRARVMAPVTRRSMLSGEKSEEEVLAVLLGLPGGDQGAQSDGARARLLQRLDLAETDEGGEFVALVDDDFSVGGSGLEGAGENVGG